VVGAAVVVAAKVVLLASTVSADVAGVGSAVETTATDAGAAVLEEQPVSKVATVIAGVASRWRR
jgi:hypothetical protein